MPDPLTFAQIFRAELAELRPALVLPADPAEAQLHAAVAADAPLAALCLSGGGIRSAAFSLGVLQALARFGVLARFDYLSTVSGGGYIGSWLTAWRKYGPNDARIFRRLDSLRRTRDAETPEVARLRAESSYLTPKTGLLSADTWTVAALYVRNVALNWLVFAPLFMGALMVPKLAQLWLAVMRSWHQAPNPLLWAALGWLAAVAGLANAVHGRWQASPPWITEGRFLARVLLPLVLSSAAFATFAAGATVRLHPAVNLVVGAVAGALAYALADAINAAVRAREGTGGRDALAAWSLGGAAAGLLLALGYNLSLKLPVELLAVLTISWVMLAYAVASAVFVAFNSYAERGDSDREWLARHDGWLLAAAAGWAALSGVALYGPPAAHWGVGYLRTYLATLTVSGAVTLAFGSGGKTAATTAGTLKDNFSLDKLVSAAGLLFAVLLAAGLAWANEALLAWVGAAHPWRCLIAAAIAVPLLVAAGYAMSYFINVNRFSLHAVYRNRLTRSFLGAVRPPRRLVRRRLSRALRRHPDPFTGFDTKDNIRMSATRPRRAADRGRLFHVINIAVNLVATRNLAWQERKAEPFTVTRLHCGCAHLGYRPTAEYGSGDGGITLGTAMAISGAAVSPNMGYHSAPLIGLLLTLFNVRLGAWLGNPRGDSYGKSGPVPGATAAVQELAGMTDDRNRWINLSDGGHFENLGLYEMVRRGCRLIVAIDAGCDPDYAFEDLGNACRKIFIDFGISIRFKEFDLKPRPKPPAAPAGGPYCAVGTISYPGPRKDGWLLYIKPGFHGDEPPHVLSYAIANATFPHQTTANQWFGESQFEAYRALGAHITEQICAAGDKVAPNDPTPPLSLDTLRRRVERYLAAVRKKNVQQYS